MRVEVSYPSPEKSERWGTRQKQLILTAAVEDGLLQQFRRSRDLKKAVRSAVTVVTN